MVGIKLGNIKSMITCLMIKIGMLLRMWKQVFYVLRPHFLETAIFWVWKFQSRIVCMYKWNATTQHLVCIYTIVPKTVYIVTIACVLLILRWHKERDRNSLEKSRTSYKGRSFTHKNETKAAYKLLYFHYVIHWNISDMILNFSD